MPSFREQQRGVEKSGEGKTYHKTPPQNGFGTPPPRMIRPPPRLFTPCHFPWRKRAQTRPIPLSEASKRVLEKLCSTIRFPPQVARYVLPPHLPFPNMGPGAVLQARPLFRNEESAHTLRIALGKAAGPEF